MEGMRGIGGAVAAAAAVLSLASAVPAAAQAIATPVVHAGEHFTTTLPDTPTGQDFTLTIDSADGGTDPPPPLLHETLQLPAGGRFDPSAIPQCDDADQALVRAEFMARQQPCPPGSYLGVDHARMDTGFTAAPDGVRYVLADVDEYNSRGPNGDEVLFVAKDPSSGQPTTVFYGSVSGGTLDVSVPFVPGAPPDGQASDRGETQSLPVAGRYRMTPPTCPPSGRWVSTSTFHFKTSPTDTTGTMVVVVQSTTACTSTAAGPQRGGSTSPPAHPPVDPPAIAVPNTGAAPADGGGASLGAALLGVTAALHRRRRTR